MDEVHGCDWPQTIHKPRVWFCDFDDNEYSPFRTKEALWHHLSNGHPQANISEPQKSLKTRLNVLSIARESNICPLCNENIVNLNVVPRAKSHEAMGHSAPESRKRKRKVAFAASDDGSESDSSRSELDGQPALDAIDTAEATKIARHIGDHLKSLAFLSIRYLDGAEDEEEERSNTGQAANGIFNDGEDDNQAGNHSGTLSSFEDVPPDQRASPILEAYEPDIPIISDQPGASTDTVLMGQNLQYPCHAIGSGRNFKFSDKTGQILEIMDRVLLPPKEKTARQDGWLRKSGATIRAFLICGDASLGKTEVALEYVHSRKSKFDAIFWLDGSTTADLNGGFAMIAERLGLLPKVRISESRPDEVIEVVHRWLENPVRQSGSSRTERSLRVEWLIVFDNVASEQTLLRVWPPSRCSHGAAIITSRAAVEKKKFPGLTSGALLRVRVDCNNIVQTESDGYDPPGYGFRQRERSEYFGMWSSSGLKFSS